MERILLLSLAVYYALRYSKTSVDPDWAMFNLMGFTGARYGKDFLDCKSPMIHYWYWAIVKLVGRSVPRVKFVHHLLVSLPGIIVGGWSGAAFIVLVNSGWLFGFHGNVGQPAAGAIFLALNFQHPWLSTGLIFWALSFEPKLIFTLFYPLLRGWHFPLFILSSLVGAAAIAARFFFPEYWAHLVEANLTIPKRMVDFREKLARSGVDFLHTPAMGLAYVLPWLIFSVQQNRDWIYWFPLAAYFLLMIRGIAVRSNHYLPLAAWIAPGLSQAQFVIPLLLVEAFSGIFYIGDIWRRFYPGLRDMNLDAQEVGKWLRDKPGRLWVNGIHTGVYIYAQKPPFGGMTEQIEIRENAQERRDSFRRAFKGDPPEWVVIGQSPGIDFSPTGYDLVARSNSSLIYRRRQDGSL